SAPSRVCVAAFYRGTPECQPSIRIKPVQLQLVSADGRSFARLQVRQRKGFSSIGGCFSIEKINSKAVSYKLKRTFIPLVLYTGVSEILPVRLAMFPFLS
ncbi:hypothetical protein ACKUG4_06475, partial [Pseudomonas glycinae]|uniref:hypothetical protein n=1 Tax=Candidatus Pseudomonas auctus TaxID=3461260 RepID=UPI003B91D5C4